MAVGELYAATGESQPTLHFREKRAAAKLGALALVGLFSLAVAFALIVALLIERLP
jgi:acyl dehydratase